MSGWITAAKLQGTGGQFCTVLFWIWGGIGFLVATMNILNMVGLTSVGVGTSAYVTAGLLYWIGGMLLFGFGALLPHAVFEFQRRPAE